MFNCSIASALLFLVFWVLWYVGKMVWPMSIKDKNAFVMWNSIYIHTIFQLVIALLSLPGYLDWSSIYESFRVNKRSKWPWQRENWSEVRKKTIANLLVNELLIYPIPCYLSTIVGIDLNF